MSIGIVAQIAMSVIVVLAWAPALVFATPLHIGIPVSLSNMKLPPTHGPHWVGVLLIRAGVGCTSDVIVCRTECGLVEHQSHGDLL